MDKIDLKNSMVHIVATDPVELKEWKVGKQYKVHMLLKMDSMEHNKDGGRAHLNIVRVIPQNKEDIYSKEAINNAAKIKG